ncbi:bifunctional DNA primase/polymerase [Micromonospora sp. DT62]
MSEAAEMVGQTTASVPRGTLLTAALRCAAAGWPVFPTHWTTEAGCSCGDRDCGSAGKHPLTRRGLHDATTDPDTITTWWTRRPTANVAIATGAPGPDVLDIDVKNGAPGAASLARLRAAGLLAGAHAIVTTWSGGWHLYYLGSEQGNGAIPRHGVDFRSRGGYVLAPPSTIYGKAYVLGDRRSQHAAGVTGIDFRRIRVALDPPPAAVPTPRRPGQPGNHRGLVEHVARQAEGNRNGALYWAACRAVADNADEAVFAELHAAALSVGLTERAAAATIASARRRNGVRA